MKIAITNNTGLRNRGCEALVVSLMAGLQRHIDAPLDMALHTNDPIYDNWRMAGRAKVLPSYLTLTPNHLRSPAANRFVYSSLALAERLLPQQVAGYSIKQMASLRAADIVLPTGGDIFTSDYNNFRKQFSSIVALEKRKAALIGHTIGPFKSEDEAYFKKTLKNVFLITVRESESYEYLKSLNLSVPVHLAADVAFGLVPTARTKASAYLARMLGIDAENTRMIALSVSEGVIRYSGLDRNKYFQEMAEFVRRMTARGFCVLLIPHVQERNPNNNDIIASEELLSHLQDTSMCKLVVGELTAADFKGIIGMTECLVGARTHATIASMSQGVPTVSIAYSRKAYGIMNDVFGAKLGGKLTIAASDLAADRLEHCFDQALAAGSFASVATRMKELAETNYVHLANALGDSQEGAMKWTPG